MRVATGRWRVQVPISPRPVRPASGQTSSPPDVAQRWSREPSLRQLRRRVRTQLFQEPKAVRWSIRLLLVLAVNLTCMVWLSPEVAALCFMTWLGLALICGWRLTGFNRAMIDDAERLQFPGAREQALVDFYVVQEDVLTGRDRGYLMLRDGRLCFNGYRSTFALRFEDVESFNPVNLGIANVKRVIDGKCLQLVSNEWDLKVVVGPVGEDHADQASFRLIEGWMRRCQATTAGAVYPPLGHDPSVPIPPSLAESVAIGALYAGLFLLGFAVFAFDFWELSIPLVFVGSIGFWRQRHALRRLRARAILLALDDQAEAERLAPSGEPDPSGI